MLTFRDCLLEWKELLVSEWLNAAGLLVSMVKVSSKTFNLSETFLLKFFSSISIKLAHNNVIGCLLKALSFACFIPKLAHELIIG